MTDYSCTCINNPSNRNGAAKRRRDLAALFYSRLSSRRREKGCGFLEAVLQECLEIELRLQGVPFVPSVRFRVFGVFRGLIPVTAVVRHVLPKEALEGTRFEVPDGIDCRDIESPTPTTRSDFSQSMQLILVCL